MLKNHGTGRVGRGVRVAFGALVVATIVRVWLGPITALPEARAQIPDAGKQRYELVKETRRTNALLQQVLKTLQTQTLKVQIQGTDNNKRRVGSLPKNGTG